MAEGEPNALLRRIRERKLDIAFVTGDCDLRDLDCEPLWREAVALALASDHPARFNFRLATWAMLPCIAMSRLRTWCASWCFGTKRKRAVVDEPSP